MPELPPARPASAKDVKAPGEKKIGLTLSGGGFRATLFHLGLVRFLYEMGLLRKVTHICSVSGGSILAAHLVLNWERYTGGEKAFSEAAAELVQFVRCDLRGRVVRPWLFSIAALGLPRLLLRGRWHRTTLLQRQYDRLYQGRALCDLTASGRPELHLLATSMTTGQLVSFNPRKLQIEKATEANSIDAGRLPVAFAVAASSAFPPLFPPVRVDAATFGVPPSSFPLNHYAADGGVFDNLGIRKLLWLNREHNLFDLVVVGDAQRQFGKDLNRYTFLLNRATRSSDLMMDRVSWLENEWVKEECQNTNTELVFCRLQDRVRDSADALSDEEQSAVQNVRTDLDDFTPHEVNALVHQGAAVARRAWAAEVRNPEPHGAVAEAESIFRQVPSATCEGRECWRPIQPKPARPFDLRGAGCRRWGLVRPSDPYAWGLWLFVTTYALAIAASLIIAPVAVWMWADEKATAAADMQRLKDDTQHQIEAAAAQAKAEAEAEAEKKAADLRQYRELHVATKVRIVGTLSRIVMADNRGEWELAKDRWKELDRELSARGDWFSGFLEDNREDLDKALEHFPSQPRSSGSDLAMETLRISHKLRDAILQTENNDYISVLKDKRKEWFDQAQESCAIIATAAGERMTIADVAPERAAFWRLYWGEMGMVENVQVSSAMVNFGEALRAWEGAPKDSTAPGDPPGEELKKYLERLTKAFDAERHEEIDQK